MRAARAGTSTARGRGSTWRSTSAVRRFSGECGRSWFAIPFGATISYGALADAIGRPDRVRAVGATVGRTPVPIVVPCHRVIGANGDLTGYGGGLQRKRALLDLEAAVAGGEPPPAVWQGRQLAMI